MITEPPGEPPGDGGDQNVEQPTMTEEHPGDRGLGSGDQVDQKTEKPNKQTSDEEPLADRGDQNVQQPAMTITATQYDGDEMVSIIPDEESRVNISSDGSRNGANIMSGQLYDTLFQTSANEGDGSPKKYGGRGRGRERERKRKRKRKEEEEEEGGNQRKRRIGASQQ